MVIYFPDCGIITAIHFYPSLVLLFIFIRRDPPVRDRNDYPAWLRGFFCIKKPITGESYGLNKWERTKKYDEVRENGLTIHNK